MTNQESVSTESIKVVSFTQFKVMKKLAEIEENDLLFEEKRHLFPIFFPAVDVNESYFHRYYQD